MSERVCGFVVVLEGDLGPDEADQVRSAIGMVRGVAQVDGQVADVGHHLAVMQARAELRSKLWAVLTVNEEPAACVL